MAEIACDLMRQLDTVQTAVLLSLFQSHCWKVAAWLRLHFPASLLPWWGQAVVSGIKVDVRFTTSILGA